MGGDDCAVFDDGGGLDIGEFVFDAKVGGVFFIIEEACFFKNDGGGADGADEFAFAVELLKHFNDGVAFFEVFCSWAAGEEEGIEVLFCDVFKWGIGRDEDVVVAAY